MWIVKHKGDHWYSAADRSDADADADADADDTDDGADDTDADDQTWQRADAQGREGTRVISVVFSGLLWHQPMTLRWHSNCNFSYVDHHFFIDDHHKMIWWW